jgi:hypothetical protein
MHCQTCAHYFDKGSECRRYAPQPSEGDTKAKWPTVAAKDWCGEYKIDSAKQKEAGAA